jgi:hypothetical protein
MQFIAKDLLTLGLSGAPKDSLTTSVADRALLTTELATECLRISGRLRICVRGESMLPTLWPGDVVDIASCSLDDVRPGEIVLAQREGRFFLHRVVARSQAGGFLLRGDSMPTADPEFSNEALLGRLAGCPPRLTFWSWAIGRVLSCWRLAHRVALRVHAHGNGYGTPLDTVAVVDIGPNPAPARGRGRPRRINAMPTPQAISELPSAGA